MILRDALKKEKGGAIGFWTTENGKKKKIWLEEDEFMKFLEKDETKETLLKAIQPGRGMETPEDREDTPPEPNPSLKPKAYISEIRPDEWNETEPREVFEENMAKQQAEQVPPKPEEAPPTPMQEIESKAIKDPSGREEFEKITPQNFSVFEKRTREKMNQKLKVFDFVDKLRPGDAAKRKIGENEEGWWDEFMESRGIRNMNIELMDDYKKDKDPEMRRLLYDWQKELTARKEETYARVNNKFFAAKQQRDKLRLSVEDQLKVKREEMNEIVRANREEAKKYTPENRVKDLKAYSKAKRNLADATNEGDKDEEIALKAEIKLLEQRLGVKAPHVLTGEESSGAAPGEEGKASSGAEEQRRNLLKDKGYNDEQIDAMMNEFKKRANA